MVKKINKFIYSSIVISILMFIMGIIFIVYPDISFTTITYILSILLIINGIYFIATKEESIFFSSFLTIGVSDILLGLVMILNPDIIKVLFPIVVGIVMIVKSVLDLRISLLLYKNEYSNSLFLFICSIISVICGLFIIINPTIGTIALTTTIGIIIIIYAISNIIDTIVFKKDINEIVKLFEK